MRKLITIILTAVLLLGAGCANQTETPSTVDAPASAASIGEEKTGTDETELAVYSNITVSVRQKTENVSERSITSEAEIQKIMFGL